MANRRRRRGWTRWRERRAGGGRPPVRAGALALPETGYFGWAGGADARFVVDCGIPGPALPARPRPLRPAELRAGPGRPRRVVVDAGVSGYEGDPLRAYCRSTRAHNTVAVGGPRAVARCGAPSAWRGRAAPVIPSLRADRGSAVFQGGCRPYHAPRTVHRRTDRVDGRPSARDGPRGRPRGGPAGKLPPPAPGLRRRAARRTA